MKKLITVVFVCLVSLGLVLSASSSAYAKHGKGNNKHKGYVKTEKSTPPGWSRGKKTGWGGASYPPGWSKWDKKKQGKWETDRKRSLTEIDGTLIRYRVEEKKGDQILRAFDETISKGREINQARKALVEALKDSKTRRWLMVDTAQRTLELLK
jgi:hypothetical protein